MPSFVRRQPTFYLFTHQFYSQFTPTFSYISTILVTPNDCDEAISSTR